MASSSSDDEVDDEVREHATNAVVLFAFTHEAALSVRSEAFARQRMQWGAHVRKLSMEGSFDRTYRMSLESFNELLAKLRDDLSIDVERSTICSGSGPIDPVIALHCLVRWLAGGSYLDVHHIAEISIPSFYRVVHRGIRAILKCEHLRMRFPKTAAEVERTASRFAACSSHQVIIGCVGCLDGMLCRIKTPSRSETRNARAFYSGHYRTPGVNVQAVCDERCRFTYLCVAAPGGTSDVRALARTSLNLLVDQLPVGKYVLADNAYVPTEHLLTPFSGTRRDSPGHDAFNFHLSQLRMKIEQAFGLMTSKWRILRRPLQVKLANVGSIVMAIARLHNYTIDRRVALLTDSIEPLEVGDASGIGFVPSDLTTVDTPGSSVIRDRIVRHIRSLALARPQYNMVRNRDRDMNEIQ